MAYKYTAYTSDKRIVRGMIDAASESMAEGVVVKNSSRQMRGKLVRPEFMKEIQEDDLWLKKPLNKNKLFEGRYVFS